MKTIKWLTPILTTSLVSASASMGLISCSSNKVPVEIENFISDRTFSLLGISVISKGGQDYYGAMCYGTGWIIDDATPSITNDYEYHVATNWHVTQGFADLFYHTPSGYTYKGIIHAYADKSSATSATGIIDGEKQYTFLKADAYQEESDEETFLYEPTTNKQGIDLYEADIDFADTATATPMTKVIKTKLDRLNSYRAKKGYINKFVCGDDNKVINKTKYVAGYPMKESGYLTGGKWEARVVNSALYYNKMHVHKIYKEDPQGTLVVADTSPQYNSRINVGDNWMTGGASGSMLLTKDFEICGIYWGGWENTGMHDFYPAFSLFNTTSKNFLEKYIHDEE